MRWPNTVRRVRKRETVGMNFVRSASIAGTLIINGGMEEIISGTPRQTGTMTIAGPTRKGFQY